MSAVSSPHDIHPVSYTHLSFINGDQLQRFAVLISGTVAGYFFDLALQATVPEIKTAKDFLQKMASDINSMNLSSCQVAQGRCV